MANYWYVSSVAGTANTSTLRTTTDITVQRTGAFSSMAAGDHFGSIAEAFLGDASGTPVAGDFIFVANDHNFSSSSNIDYGSATAVDTPVIVMSVLETACDQYTAGATEAITGGAADFDLAVVGAKVRLIGVDLGVTDNIQPTGIHAGTLIIEDATVTFDGSGDQISLTGDGFHFGVKDSTLSWTSGTTTACFVNPYGAHIQFDNVIIDGGSGTVANLMDQGGINGALIARFDNCDFSEVAGYIWSNFGSDSAIDDNVDVRLRNCKTNSTADPFVEENFQSHGQYFLATNCSDNSDEAEYQLYQKTIAGTVRDSGDDGTAGGIYRVESTAFSAGNKVSYKCVTTASCGEGSPLVFEMPARFADLTNAASDAVTIYIASAGALTTANCWIEVSYPDATNKQTWETVTSRAADILSSTALTTDSGSDWENAGTDLTTENEYLITLATSTGAACVPLVRFFCTVPSVTFYVDTTIGLS